MGCKLIWYADPIENQDTNWSPVDTIWKNKVFYECIDCVGEMGVLMTWWMSGACYIEYTDMVQEYFTYMLFSPQINWQHIGLRYLFVKCCWEF
jgi:hypothetical protein